MFEPQQYPWQLRPEDLPASKHKQPIRLATTQLPNLLIMAGIILAGSIWVAGQAYVLDIDYLASVNENELPRLAQGKIAVLPAPLRYNLMKEASEKTEPVAPVVELPKVEESKMVPVSLTAPSFPIVETLTTFTPQAVDPVFNLIGIASGEDGSVATLKITDDASGIKDEMHDVRVGSPLLSGYQVTKITPEYVLIKKGGKTIRVD